nr:MAG TPA: hypothetical protein [Caudoviricetes sp.]
MFKLIFHILFFTLQRYDIFSYLANFFTIIFTIFAIFLFNCLFIK